MDGDTFCLRQIQFNMHYFLKMYSLYSIHSSEREKAKDELEMAGALARYRGKNRNENPYLSKSEREMALQYPNEPIYFDSEKNLSAYYWECGWENYQDWKNDLTVKKGKI